MIVGLLLAAGGSTRFGSQKLLAPVGGVPVVRRAATVLASEVDALIVVTGADADAVSDALAGVGAMVVRNGDWRDGLSTSLRAGVDATPAQTDALLVALGDQPLIPPGTARAVITRWHETDASIVVPAFAGVRGHPVLFARALFPELRRITGDTGAREVIASNPDRISVVDLPMRLPVDVDTRRDLRLVESDGE